MENFEKQGGVSFFLLSFTKRDEFYYLRLDMLLEFWKRAKEGGRKSFRYEELDPEYFLPRQRGVLVPYLDALQKDLLLQGLTIILRSPIINRVSLAIMLS